MDEEFCNSAVKQTIDTFGTIDILVNNAGVQFPQSSILDITAEQLDRTFRTNIFAMFYITKAALPHMKAGDSIINTASITAYQGAMNLLDYSSTKGAIVSFTRSLSLNLESQHIRVNAVAPGPTWTPLTVSSYAADVVQYFGLSVPYKRAGQPFELAPTYVYLACDDSGLVSGQVLHVNGGAMVES
jgi:NAD(P)-dependent dehydrogenase (short-subunit alcohol dehydrogenase family)